ncbi:MAG TPA: tetratricopeptide repeat protein [Planctomycetota bacterium]|jgi:tetratricopeptide (TPR) repeat protein|nr:tetratricopeptide repeat protein [Planctomycetota bacterium]
MDSEASKFCDLGRQFLDRGEPEEALRCYERAIDVDPESSEAWWGRGKAAYDLGRLERADRDYLRAMRLARRGLVVSGGEADLKSRRWWSDPATRPFLRALHGHGLCEFWLGHYDESVRVFRRLLKLAPTDPLDVRFLVGESYLRMGRIERAIRELEACDDDTDALVNLGLARFYRGDFAGSVNAFRRGLFANLYLPALLCERPPEKEGPGGEEGTDNTGLDRKGLDNESAANDYLDRCGDFWMGRPVVQRWLDGILHHPLVDADLRRHVRHVKELSGTDLSAGARARVEGENTTLRSPARLAATDRTVATDVLAQVFTLAPLPSAK